VPLSVSGALQILPRVLNMYLTAPSLACWLFQRGLLDPLSITDGQFAVQEVQRHNRGFRVFRPDAAPLYVKQLRVFDQPNVACLQREAAFGRAVSNCCKTQWLTSRIPEFLDYDSRHHAVTVRLLPDASDLHEYLERHIALPDSMMHQLGSCIARFSTPECHDILSVVAADHVPGEAPWILSFHRDQGAGFLNAGNLAFLKTLQGDQLLTSSLDELRDGWQAGALMHGDLKWNNVLLRMGAGEVADWYIIDWEMMDRGDPLWDLATMVQCWWSYWILSTPLPLLTDLATLCIQRRGAYDEIRNSLEALWSGYSETLQLSDRELDECRSRLVKLAAARLLQSVSEYLNLEGVAVEYIEVMIAMSRQVFAEPESMSEFFPGARS